MFVGEYVVSCVTVHALWGKCIFMFEWMCIRLAKNVLILKCGMSYLFNNFEKNGGETQTLSLSVGSVIAPRYIDALCMHSPHSYQNY